MSIRVLYAISEDWFFASHFQERALRHHANGAVIGVATHHGSSSLQENDEFHKFDMDTERGSLNVVADVRAVFQLSRAIRRFRPDILHCVAMKPILFGALVSMATRLPCVFAPTGLGYLFTRNTVFTRISRVIFLQILRLALRVRHNHVIIENEEDRQSLVASGIVRAEQIHLVRGAGIDFGRFNPSDEPDPPVIILCVARLLVDKGIREFFAAAAQVSAMRPEVRFVLVGDIDSKNPSSLTHDEARRLATDSAVLWSGPQASVEDFYRTSHIVCLPSYREGLPKVLLEAAASKRCIVTTDTIGCREIITDKVTGILVPVADSDALAGALLRVIDDAPLRRQLAEAAYDSIKHGFSVDDVSTATEHIYDLACKS